MTVYPIQLEGSLSPGMHQAFQDMVSKQQATMATISQEHQKMAERNSALEAQNRALQEENQAMRAQISRMGGVVAAPAVAGAAAAGVGMDKSGGKERFQLVKKIKVHDQPVHGVAVDPDSEVVATASWDATVKIYNLEKREVVRSLEQDMGHSMMGLYAVSFGKVEPGILGCACSDHCVYLWESGTGRLLRKLAGHTNEVNGLDFHPTQHVLCSASDDLKAIVWDYDQGTPLRTLEQHTKPVYGTTFLGSESPYLVATCCFDRETRVFDMRTKRVEQSLTGHSDDIVGIDYSPESRHLATGSDDGTVKVYDARTWKLAHSIKTNSDPKLRTNEVKRVAFSRDGGLLAAACSTGRVLVYDVHTAGRPVASLHAHGDAVFGVAWGRSKQGARALVSASHDCTCGYWLEQL